MTPTLQRGVEAALVTERAATTKLINTLRFAAVAAFFALFVLLGGILGLREWRGNLDVFAVYFIISGAVFITSRTNARVAALTPMTIAFLDVPVVFVLELQQFASSTSPGAVAGFNLGIYVLVVLLAALTLERRWIYLTAFVAMLFEGLLQHFASVTNGAIVASAIVLATTAAAAGYSSGRLAVLTVNMAQNLRALRESEDHFRQLIEEIPVALAVLDAGEVLYANPALLSYLRADTLTSFRSIMSDPTLIGDWALAAEQRVCVEARLVRGDGARAVAQLSVLPVAFQGRDAAAVVLRDLTELRLAQEERLRMESLVAAGQLAASIGSWLKTPVSAAMLAHEHISRLLTAAGDRRDGRVSELLSVLEDRLKTCIRLSDDLAFGGSALELEPLSARSLVADAIRDVRLPKQVQIKNRIPESLPPVRLSRASFRRAVAGLIESLGRAWSDNAGEIIINGYVDGSDVQLSLVATGTQPGPHDPTDDLALALVAHIVRRHKGTLVSTRGSHGGAHVSIRLPRQADDAQHTRDFRPRSRA